jgi:curved DNA-binding protein CbpA
LGSSHYEILGVPVTATAREITRAYRGLLRRFHPDTRQENHDGGTAGPRDTERLHAIMQAYAVLSDPAKRAAYDRALRAGSSGTPAGRNGSTGTPVKVRFHTQPADTQPAKPQPGTGALPPDQPLRYGPTRWSPSPGGRPTFPRRPL